MPDHCFDQMPVVIGKVLWSRSKIAEGCTVAQNKCLEKALEVCTVFVTEMHLHSHE